MLELGKIKIYVNAFKRKRGTEIMIIVLLIFSLSGCIEPYDPEIEGHAELMTIEGRVCKGEDEHILTITRTSSISNPRYIEVDGCVAEIIDQYGNHSFYKENLDGTYTLKIRDELLVPGEKYMLRVTTPEGEVYESDYELMPKGVEVDSVYYFVENRIDNYTRENISGVQFYVDVEAPDTLSRYYRWIMEETFEYHSVTPISYWYVNADSIYTPDNPMEWFTCWATRSIPGLYVTNTINLKLNEKKRIPLNYVKNSTDRLKIMYSLLIRQYAMTEGAFAYYEKAKYEAEEGEGLYTKQPGLPITNLRNVNDTTEIVLGYFWLSEMKEKRIFVPPIEGYFVDYNCEKIPFETYMLQSGPWPKYIFNDEVRGGLWTGFNPCFNCLLRGGTNVEPDFWIHL